MNYWLLKTEPGCFSIDDLARAKKTFWDGVRNYQARNFMQEMRLGDEVFVYHSNADPPAVVGIAKIVREAYPDHTAFDPSDKHYDPASSVGNPRWYMVDVQFVRKFKMELPLPSLREQRGLSKMELLRKGSRLSVQPVGRSEWKIILKLAAKHDPGSDRCPND